MSRKIKSSSIYRYNYIIQNINADEVDLEEYLYQYFEYDETGNKILEVNFTPDGAVQDKTEKQYDDAGHLTEQKYFDGEDILAEHLSFERDEKGNILKEYLHYLDGSRDVTTYEYDEEGKLILKSLRDDEDHLEMKEIYTYQNGKRVLYERYEEEELVKKEESGFDEEGNLINSRVTDHLQEDHFRLEHEYENGNRIRTFRYDEHDKLIEKLEFRYEQENVKLVIQQTPAGKVVQQYEHDEKGNILKQEEFNKDNQLNNSIERIYDEDGNPLEAKVYINLHGQGIDRNYILKYKYQFMDT
ncbi:MAG: hypothetical protein U5Q03_01645 [Bacteroidota bacterium]|nr:hypothetical protein [Bacteroidota bacterium]